MYIQTYYFVWKLSETTKNKWRLYSMIVMFSIENMDYLID